MPKAPPEAVPLLPPDELPVLPPDELPVVPPDELPVLPPEEAVAPPEPELLFEPPQADSRRARPRAVIEARIIFMEFPVNEWDVRPRGQIDRGTSRSPGGTAPAGEFKT